MGHILRCALVLLVADGTIVNFRVFSRDVKTVVNSFELHGVVPDVVPVAPSALAFVTYPGGVEVNEGNVLTPTQVKDVPTVTWEADPEQFYTLAMTDPDVPSRADPVLREMNHWLVGNIKGNEVASGEPLDSYLGSEPPQGSGLHRYVFLVYKQTQQINFDEPREPNIPGSRAGFSIAKFAEKYNLGDPIAGNFFQAAYEESIPLLYKQLDA